MANTIGEAGCRVAQGAQIAGKMEPRVPGTLVKTRAVGKTVRRHYGKTRRIGAPGASNPRKNTWFPDSRRANFAETLVKTRIGSHFRMLFSPVYAATEVIRSSILVLKLRQSPVIHDTAPRNGPIPK